LLNKDSFLASILSKVQYIQYRVRNLHDILHKYRLPFVSIQGGDIKSAIEIFSRLNSTGTGISKDYILSARSYGETEFNLIDSITEFLNSLDIYNFENLKRDTILNCIYNAKGKIYFDVKSGDLLQPDLQKFTNDAYEHIKKAVDFLYRILFVIDISESLLRDLKLVVSKSHNCHDTRFLSARFG
jgi:hypothetical protein